MYSVIIYHFLYALCLVMIIYQFTDDYLSFPEQVSFADPWLFIIYSLFTDNYLSFTEHILFTGYNLLFPECILLTHDHFQNAFC